jgi:hypothetical protein
MGALRATLLEKNLIVFGTEFPGSYDALEPNSSHYSVAHITGHGIYGEHQVYVDHIIANEDLQFTTF